MLKNEVGELIPHVIQAFQLGRIAELSVKRFFRNLNIDELPNLGGVAIGPSNFAALSDLIAADVLNVVEQSTSLFSCFPNSRFERVFIRLYSARRYAPSSVSDLAYQDFSLMPGKHKGGKCPKRRSKWRWIELEGLPPIFAAWKSFQRGLMTFPIIWLSSTAPNFRESSETSRLSPKTYTEFSGT